MKKNEKIFEILKKYDYPDASGLIYINEFTFLVAIILSAQARDEFVNTQTRELFKVAPTAEEMVELGLDGICTFINKIGLWRNKGANIYKMAGQICELKKMSQSQAREWYNEISQKYFNQEGDLVDDLELFEKDFSRKVVCIDGSEPVFGLDSSEILSNEGVPKFRLGLLKLAGIGRKSANVFLNFVYGAKVFPVDTHVVRLTNRLGIAEGNPEKIEKILQEVVPENFAEHASNWLVWHGRRVCFARKPNCLDCLLKNYCNFFKK